MFRFFRYQTSLNPTASSSQSRSKKFVYSGFLQLFFGVYCRKRRSIRAGSFFEDSKISLGQWLNIIYLWSIDILNKQRSLITGFSLRTIATTLAKIRQIYSLKILHGNIKLGGRGKTVEIDESMFGHKRKYNRGRVSEGTWVFGMVERGSGRTLTFRSHERDLSNQTGTRVHPTRNSDPI